MSPAFVLACGTTHLKIRFLVCLSWKDLQKGFGWGGEFEWGGEVRGRFRCVALRGPSALTSLLPYYQFPCPLQTSGGYSKPRPNCVTATQSKMTHFTTSKQVLPYCCLSVKVSYLVQDNSLYVLHIYFQYVFFFFLSSMLSCSTLKE